LITTDPGGRFPRTARLRTPSEFRAVYSLGRKRRSSSFVVFVLPTARAVIRFGLTTPRKLGKANERNRVRRRLREMLRRDRALLATGYDVVINPRRAVLVRDFEELRSELRSLLQGLAS
jgi:ribonuclease P protein component